MVIAASRAHFAVCDRVSLLDRARGLRPFAPTPPPQRDRGPPLSSRTSRPKCKRPQPIPSGKAGARPQTPATATHPAELQANLNAWLTTSGAQEGPPSGGISLDISHTGRTTIALGSRPAPGIGKTEPEPDEILAACPKNMYALPPFDKDVTPQVTDGWGASYDRIADGVAISPGASSSSRSAASW
jgi:hypothetical protein